MVEQRNRVLCASCLIFQVEEAYAQLVNFISCSWELYRAELEAVTFPVFVHCYLILANTEHSDQVKGGADAVVGKKPALKEVLSPTEGVGKF